MINKSKFLIAASLLVLTTGCDDTKKALGFEKSTPNEFKVSSHPPLSLPPDYGLRPPRDGEELPVDNAAERASKALTGQKIESDGSLSPAESALLKKAGAAEVPDNIRQIVKSEEQDANELGLWDKIKEGTLIVDKKEKGVAIDPAKERDRLKTPQENKEQGKEEKPAEASEDKISDSNSDETKPAEESSIKLDGSTSSFKSIEIDPESMKLPSTLDESVEKSN